MLNSTEHEISTAHSNYAEKEIFLAFKLIDIVIIMLINVEMPTIVGISTFINMINFILT